jgi:hypothetical protein
MSNRELIGDVVLPSTARTVATYVSGPVAAANEVQAVLLTLHATAVTGSVVASLEESTDGSTWTAIPGSATASLSAAGNALAFASTTKAYVRATTTVGTTSATYSVGVAFLGT